MTPDANSEVEATRRLLRDHGLMADDEPTTPRITLIDSTRLARKIQARQPARSRPRRPLVAFAAAAACLALVVVVGVGELRPEPTNAATPPRMLTYTRGDPAELAATPSGASVLLAAAALAAAQPAGPATGDVQYVASYGWSLSIEQDGTSNISSRIYPTLTRSWLAPDGSATVTQSRGVALDIDGRTATGSPTGIGGTDTLPVDTFNAGLVATLADANLQDLDSALLALASPEPCDQDARWHAQCLIDAAQQLYGFYVIPPELASHLWQLLADEPDLRDLGTTTDRFGRHAWAVALSSSDPGDTIRSTVTVLLISPETGQISGTETITLSDTVTKVTSPTVTQFTAWTAHAWVQRDAERSP